ncbi:MAG: thiamine pyrophosphate-binding protein [Bacteroidetes bacterium]|nr:thiamine pyrophosphate-binding protein [Bacteroidota bacterium]
MKVSDYIAKFLEAKKIDYVFELSGGMITNILDSLNQTTKINIISMHHEQSAAFAADAYGRITGKPGVALATSGPGATNLITGIGSCYFDSVPGIFITGQVNRHELKGEKQIRQLGFQETDIVSIAKPLTKKCYQIKDAKEIPLVFKEAFHIVSQDRPGPVLIDIPMDIQRAQIDSDPYKDATEIDFTKCKVNIDTQINNLINSIRVSKSPIIIVGRGVKASFASKELNEFLTKTKIPVVTSLLALDAISYNHPQRVGFIGSYGNRWANIAFGESDLIIAVGSRLDIRQTGADTVFFENREIYHVDCNENEISNRIKNCIPIVCDAKVFFSEFISISKNIEFEAKANWITYISNLKTKWPDTKELDCVGINPNKFIHLLSSCSHDSLSFLADVGSHQMWAAQSLEINTNQTFLTSGGMGAMGFALPAAIGACFALNKKPVVAIIGDGCMQINIQELQTIVRNKLPIKIVVLNNENLGMIRQFQDSYFESRYQSTCWGYSAPNFEFIALAYQIKAKTISNYDDAENAIKWMWNSENKDNPVLLQVMIDSKTNTYPKIAFGKPITEMEPHSKPTEMEGT